MRKGLPAAARVAALAAPFAATGHESPAVWLRRWDHAERTGPQRRGLHEMTPRVLGGSS